MANISITDVNDSIPTLVAAEALGALYSSVVISNVVNRDYENEFGRAGQSIKIPFLGSLTANSKAEDTDITLNAPTDTAVTLTLDQHEEVSFVIEDTARVFANPDLLAGYARQAALTLATKIETTLAALYSGFSQTINATSGLTEAHFREARRLAQCGQGAAVEPLGHCPRGRRERSASDRAADQQRLRLLGCCAEWQPGHCLRLQRRDVAERRGFGGQCKNLFIQRDRDRARHPPAANRW